MSDNKYVMAPAKALQELRCVIQSATPSIDFIHERGPEDAIERAWLIMHDDILPAIAAAPQAEQPQAQDEREEAFCDYWYAQGFYGGWSANDRGDEAALKSIHERAANARRAMKSTEQPAQKPEDKAEQQAEPVITAEALLRSVYTRPDLTEQGRELFFREFMKGEQELTLSWGDFRMMAATARAAHPSPASTHQQNVSKSGGEIDRLSDERIFEIAADFKLPYKQSVIDFTRAIERALLAKGESK